MKNILCYGDSNTWGNIAGSRNPELMLAKRYDRGIRWSSVLQQILGDDFYIIEAGLNGRNTSFDETVFVRPSRNGLATLPLILEMNYPLDLVILMLGTNDVLNCFNAEVEQTVSAMQKMIQHVKQCHLGLNFTAPQVLLIAPAPLVKIDSEFFTAFFDDGAVEKTHQFAAAYEKLAIEENCVFLNAGAIVKVDLVDGIHIAKQSQALLAKAIAEKILTMPL